LLLPAYTITGFDASANTAEETVGAGLTVPKAMVSAVISSSFFGGLMLAAVVLAMPSVAQGAAQGGSVFFWTLQQVLPDGLRLVLLVGIALCQYLCGLATLTSASRMVYAFARDGGLPGSSVLRQVSQVYLTPVFAIWAVALFSWAFTLETQVYSTITAVCTIFLYSSYVFPIFLGLLAFRRSWTQMGPWDLGQGFRVVACLAVLANCGLLFIGCQPPNQKTLPITLGFLALMALIWFGYERRRFRGPAMLRGIES
jgi:amino acid transporter